MNLDAADPRVRAAAECFERETGRKLDDTLVVGVRMVELFLVLNGYGSDLEEETIKSPLSRGATQSHAQ